MIDDAKPANILDSIMLFFGLNRELIYKLKLIKKYRIGSQTEIKANFIGNKINKYNLLKIVLDTFKNRINEITNNNTLNILYDNITYFPSINIMLNTKYPKGPYADPEKNSSKLYNFKLFFKFNASKTALEE